MIVTTVAGPAYGFLRPYADYMRQQGWWVALATSELESRPGVENHFDEIFPMEWRRQATAFRDNFGAMHRIRTILRTGRFDVVHTHTPISSFLVRIANAGVPRSVRPRVIYMAHGFHFHRNGNPLTNFAFRVLEKAVSIWTDYLVVINDEDERGARRLRLVQPGRLLKVPGVGLPLSDYRAVAEAAGARAKWRRQLGVEADTVLIVMVAEFSPGKRHQDLLAAMCLPGSEAWHVVFAGEGKTLAEMKQRASELGLNERCHFLGFCRAIPELLASADVSVLPSEREGLPRSVMESMVAGVPVVGADSRGIRDLLTDNCGLLHPVGDVAELQRALLRVITSPPLRRALAANAARKILRYDLAPLLLMHAALYEAAAERRVFRVVTQETAPFVSQPLPRRVLVVGAAGSTLVNIRSPIMRAFVAAGCEVIAAASEDDGTTAGTLAAWGIRYYHLPMSRTGKSPLADAKYCLALVGLVRRESIDLILAYTHKPVLYTAVAKALIRPFHRVKCYALITGLGYAFTEDPSAGAKRVWVMRLIKLLYRVTTPHFDGITFQNPDDARFFEEHRLLPAWLPRITVRGSGVDVGTFPFVPPKPSPIHFVFIARLLSSKGVRDFATAALRLAEEDQRAMFTIVGPLDPNPSGIPEWEIQQWRKSGVLEYVGPAMDVRPFLRDASAYVLPSYYREGIPRTVLEAMATGRAIITADTPGCRETIFEPGPAGTAGIKRGLNGFLVPASSPAAIAEAMRALIVEPALVEKMGRHSRDLAERYFDVRLINQQMIAFMDSSSLLRQNPKQYSSSHSI